VVHLRFFMAIASDDNIQTIIDNLNSMLSLSSPSPASHKHPSFAPRPHPTATPTIPKANRPISMATNTSPKSWHSTDPGGYLQWVEWDWLSHFPSPSQITSADYANTQWTGYLKKTMALRESQSTPLFLFPPHRHPSVSRSFLTHPSH